jgi:predicted phage-related endonuclease
VPLLLTQVPSCDVAVLFGNADLRIYQIPSDPELEALLLEHAIRFWEDHVLKDIPPPAKCEADYQHLFERGTQRMIDASPEIVKLIQELLRVQEQIEQQEQQVSQMKQRIMGVMEDAEILHLDGKVLATWKAPKPSVGDGVEQGNVLLQKYRVVHQYGLRKPFVFVQVVVRQQFTAFRELRLYGQAIRNANVLR